MRKKRSCRSLATQARDREQALARKLRWNGTSWTSEVAEAPSRSAELQAQQDRQRKLQDSLASANKNCFIGQQLKRQTCIELLRTTVPYRTLSQVSHWSAIPREPCIWSSCSKREWETAVQQFRKDLVAAHEALVESL